MGVRLYVCFNVARLALRRLRGRCLCAAYRRLASEQQHADRLRSGCSGASAARSTTELCMDGLIHHSDRGSQYVSIRYIGRLIGAGIEPSIGSKGDSYDNALAATINGLYKAELIYRQPQGCSETVATATLKWVHWYNHQRLLSSIGYILPAETVADFYRQQIGQTMLAWFKRKGLQKARCGSFVLYEVKVWQHG